MIQSTLCIKKKNATETWKTIGQKTKMQHLRAWRGGEEREGRRGGEEDYGNARETGEDEKWGKKEDTEGTIKKRQEGRGKIYDDRKEKEEG